MFETTLPRIGKILNLRLIGNSKVAWLKKSNTNITNMKQSFYTFHWHNIKQFVLKQKKKTFLYTIYIYMMQ